MTAFFTFISLFDPVLIVTSAVLALFARRWWWVFMVMFVPALGIELMYTLSGLRRMFGTGLVPLYFASVFWGFGGYLLRLWWLKRKRAKQEKQ